jgi:hypothetical protein
MQPKSCLQIRTGDEVRKPREGFSNGKVQTFCRTSESKWIKTFLGYIKIN